MKQNKIIVVALDGLTPSALGCYGSSWSATPNIDALATRGCVWDRLIANHSSPIESLRTWLTPKGSSQSDDGDWLSAWQSKGAVDWISDSPAAINLATKLNFDQLQLIDAPLPDIGDDPDGEPASPAIEIESTQFAQLVAATIERINDPEPWSMIWLHSHCLTNCWDAPRWLVATEQDDEAMLEPLDDAQQLEFDDTDEDTLESLPILFDEVAVPHLQLNPNDHPDLIATWMTTYACQIRLIDELLGVLMDAAGDTCFVLVGTSGFALGQNGWIGHLAGPLRSSQLRLPLIIGNQNSIRSRRVTSSDSLPNMIRDLCYPNTNLISPDDWAEVDDEFAPFVLSHGADNSRSVTTNRWFLVQDQDDQRQLFLKPDDIDDSNDVGRLRPDAIDNVLKSIDALT